MPIRLRITFLFTFVVFIILGVVCLSIYYFSASSRVSTIKTRLTNRAITTERLLRQSELFDRNLIHRIDSLTTLSLKNKSVRAFNNSNDVIYNYNEVRSSSLVIGKEILQEAREKEIFYFARGKMEAVAYHNPDNKEGVVVICAAEDEDGNNILHRLRKILIISFIGGTFLSFAGGLFFSTGLLQPVRKITIEVNDISAYNLDRRIHTGQNKDEWYQLSVTLNQLLDRLKDSFELQRRFISNASHELSTPLTLISSQLEISLQRNRSEEEYRKAMSLVLQDVQHMNNLVQTLLKFATASGNDGGLDIDLVRIDEILMRLPGQIQKQDKEHSVSLQFNDLPEQEEKLLVFGNEELLFTAVQNIVVNACKYSPDHHADAALYLNENGFSITVTDKGIGIEENELKNIFQPFYRIGESRTAKGVGLGLSLANRIIKLHKGTITVVSKPGLGTTFTIELPAGHTLTTF
ncbi:MAG: HAMP domain-containing sensor histidine kinase [Chitinophagaceae bacterium]